MSLLDTQSEDDKYLLSFLERTFFRGFKENIENFNSVEYFIGKNCNLNCKYCYLAKYGNYLHPQKENPREISLNAQKLTDFLASLNFRGRIEIFSGEPLIKEHTFDIINYILDSLTHAIVVIPTNMTFLFDEKMTDNVIDLLKSRRVFLSASVDGKYMQNVNRPHKAGLIFDDEMWERLFAFAKRWDIGFHPMIYSHNIEKWRDNFLWFIQKFEEYRMDPFSSLYLLEVRNPEWSREQCRELKNFMEFLAKYTYQRLAKGDYNNLVDIIFEKKGFNILSSPFTTVGRGLGCSIQAALTVRVADLSIVPCHRLAYKQFIAGFFMSDNEKIVGIKAHNPYLYSAIVGTSQHAFPYCERCILNGICAGGCLGAQYEYFGDPFIPIPSVCMMEHAKYLGIFNGFKDVGALDYILAKTNAIKKLKIKNFLEVMNDGSKRYF